MKHILHILFVVSIVCMLLSSCSTNVEPTLRRKTFHDSVPSGGTTLLVDTTWGDTIDAGW